MALEADAVIRLGTLSAEVASRIVNASERGLLLALPAPRPVGTRIRVRVRIDDPAYEISVAGIIVHVATIEGAAPEVSTQAGIFLTETGPDWRALCRRLARDAP